MLTFLVVTFLSIGVYLAISSDARALVSNKVKLLPEKTSNVVRGSVSEIAQSVWENPEEWNLASENLVQNNNGTIGIWIGDGQDCVKIIGMVSMSDLWGEEQELLWEATKFFESSVITKLLSVPSNKSVKENRESRKVSEQIGRRYVFKNGDIVLEAK